MYNVLTLACRTNGLYEELLDCKNNLPANTEISTCRARNSVIHVPWETLLSCPVYSHYLVPYVQRYAYPS